MEFSHIKLLYTCNCKKCGKEYTVNCTEYTFNKGNYKLFCSRQCANSRIISDSVKLKISETLSEKNKNNKNYICKYCKKPYSRSEGLTKTFCSLKCKQSYNKEKVISEETRKKLSDAGKHSALVQSEYRRSKNEIEFYSLCKNYFNIVTHNEPIFNGWDADVLIYDYKIAVLWNGPWHYRKITKQHSVEQVLNRDKIKIKEILTKGWIPYIIKDMGKLNSIFVHEQFENFLIFLKNFL